jgi:hypothetical protein
MLDDGVKDKQMKGEYENVEVMDVANLLLRSMNGTAPSPNGNGQAGAKEEAGQTDA